jgi:hypothetical protein
MTIEELKELIIANTLRNDLLYDRWGMFFPKEAWDENTESVDLSAVKPYWIYHDCQKFGLHKGYYYTPVRDADSHPAKAIDEHLCETDVLSLVGYEFRNGRLYMPLYKDL